MKFKLLLVLACCTFIFSSCGTKPTAKELEKQEYAQRVKDAFVKGWNSYKTYAWGMDAVNPISEKGHNWYSHTLLMTPVDAFSTMYLMGLDDIVKENKELILSELTFDLDMEVQQFEIAIRIVGGLVSAYQLDGDERFLALAKDLGDRLMPVFDTPTGIPYRLVNLRTGEIKGNVTNPCEVGCMMLEYGMLSKLTGDPKYYDLTKKGVKAIYDRRGTTGLVGSGINCDTGEWTSTSAHISGGIDAYYEYLLKSYLLFGDEDFKDMWETCLTAVNTHLGRYTDTGYWVGGCDMNDASKKTSNFGALDCFWGGCLALSGETQKAEDLQKSIFKMWQIYGLEPESINFETMIPNAYFYMARPEAIEATYYTWKATGKDEYYEMGKTMFESIEKNCQVENGYVQIRDVRDMKKWDTLESFFFAETMKYCYLFFAEDDVFSFDDYVLNSEAHPFKNTWDKDWKGGSYKLNQK